MTYSEVMSNEDITEAAAALLNTYEPASKEAVGAIVNGLLLSRSSERRTPYEGMFSDDDDKKKLLQGLLALHGLAIRGDSLSQLILKFLQTPYLQQ